MAVDLLAELENMVSNATLSDEVSRQTEQEVWRWQKLFGYTYADAVKKLQDHRDDLSRKRMSKEFWQIIRSEWEAEGYTLEAYEHWINDKPSNTTTPSRDHASLAAPMDDSDYLVLLQGPLHDPDQVRRAAKLEESPACLQGTSEGCDAQFCRIAGTSKRAIIGWLSDQKTSFKPTFVRLSKAKKDLDAHSQYPKLSVESTLPQHRLSEDSESCLPHQNDYPVWYFFYGTLADKEVLKRQLMMDEDPVLVPATITGGGLQTWAGRYKALVDGSEDDVVSGSAFVVNTPEQEDALRIYETERYEIVRCTISIGSGDSVRGLTFRFKAA